MAQMNFLTQCTFDFGALAQLPKVLKANVVTRPFVVTDPGLKSNGLLDTLLSALGEPPASQPAAADSVHSRRRPGVMSG